MEYPNRPARYDSEIYHYEDWYRYLFITFWVGSVLFYLLPVFIVGLFAMMGMIPWPWTLFKKGFWIGECPLCGKENCLEDKEDAMESEAFVCSCGANFRLIKGSEFAYIPKGPDQ
jgi:hypothetical protein